MQNPTQSQTCLQEEHNQVRDNISQLMTKIMDMEDCPENLDVKNIMTESCVRLYANLTDPDIDPREKMNLANRGYRQAQVLYLMAGESATESSEIPEELADTFVSWEHCSSGGSQEDFLVWVAHGDMVFMIRYPKTFAVAHSFLMETAWDRIPFQFSYWYNGHIVVFEDCSFYENQEDDVAIINGVYHHGSKICSLHMEDSIFIKEEILRQVLEMAFPVTGAMEELAKEIAGE